MLKGKFGDDTLSGNNGNDRMFGRAGDDLMKGGAGNDLMQGGFGDDEMHGGLGNDTVRGGAGNDVLSGDRTLTAQDFDSEGYLTADAIGEHGNDRLNGGIGDDTITSALGSDTLRGGQGNDRLISYSDSNTPAENPAIPASVNDGNDLDKLAFTQEFINPLGLDANDRLVGGAGADTFEFRLQINAPKDIVAKHTNADGSINWGMNGVAGENNNYHDHWVDGIGFERIADFSGTGGEGDKIIISGHTVTYKVIKENDKMIRLGVYSDQGADGARGNGAHDLDVLGVINVRHDGNFNLQNDVIVDKVDYGAY
ncbi:MAG: calcium-binding protein [Cyanobacteria bacterium P01_E01_bin.34]